MLLYERDRSFIRGLILSLWIRGKLFAAVRRERKFNRRTKLWRWNSITVWGLVFKVAVDFHRRQLYSAFDFCREKSYLNLNKFPNEDAFSLALFILFSSRRRPPLKAHSSLFLTLRYPLLLSRRRCRKSRVHFPHFSPSWRAARATGHRAEVLKKSCVGRQVGGRMPGRETLLSEGCETSPLRRNREPPRHFTTRLCPGITSLLSADPVFMQLCEQIVAFCGVYPQDLQHESIVEGIVVWQL